MADLYKEAASLLHRANIKEGSLKTLVYSSNYQNLRQLFALVSECVKYQDILKDVLSRCSSDILAEEVVDNDTNMAVVLLYEVLVGKGFGRNGYLRKVMRKYNKEIKSAKDALLKENNVKYIMEIVEKTSSSYSGNPRYARVNLIKCSVEKAIEDLCLEGYKYVGKISNDGFPDMIKSLNESQFGLDSLLDDVFIFPINTDLHNHPLVMNGTLILQDRASCVPAHVLNPEPGQIVLDCCAAPGNKTSHLASLMKDQGRVIALDRDTKRMTTMKSLLERSGYQSVEYVVQDFMTLSPASPEVNDITKILVDPSCSGSGMVNQRMTGSDRTANPARLETLKRFQILLLKHALRFPNAQRVVYSTCSVHQQENEEVVEEVMSNVGKHFHFVPVLPQWPDSRGLKTFRNYENFLRLSPEKHLTNGFFVACFERRTNVKHNVTSKSNNRKSKSKDRKNDAITDCDANASVCDIDKSSVTRKQTWKQELTECSTADCKESEHQVMTSIKKDKSGKLSKDKGNFIQNNLEGLNYNVHDQDCIDITENDEINKCLIEMNDSKNNYIITDCDIIDRGEINHSISHKAKKKKKLLYDNLDYIENEERKIVSHKKKKKKRKTDEFNLVDNDVNLAQSNWKSDNSLDVNEQEVKIDLTENDEKEKSSHKKKRKLKCSDATNGEKEEILEDIVAKKARGEKLNIEDIVLEGGDVGWKTKKKHKKKKSKEKDHFHHNDYDPETEIVSKKNKFKGKVKINDKLSSVDFHNVEEVIDIKADYGEIRKVYRQSKKKRKREKQQ